jgi:hypothetical protein
MSDEADIARRIVEQVHQVASYWCYVMTHKSLHHLVAERDLDLGGT